MLDEFLNRLAGVIGVKYSKADFGRMAKEGIAEFNKEEKAAKAAADAATNESEKTKTEN